MNTAYPIESAEKFQTTFGEAMLLTLQESPQTSVKVFLPRRYGALFTDNDLHSINEKSLFYFPYIFTIFFLYFLYMFRTGWSIIRKIKLHVQPLAPFPRSLLSRAWPLVLTK